MTRRPPLLLCAGLQSSGSSLLSWCFLQRPDTNGVFDAANDILPALGDVHAEYCWCKVTISCFSLEEMVAHYRDAGFEDIRPILIVRDVRAIFNSLLRKSYGSNGTTAEDPPLRLRLRRFLRDWMSQVFPIVRYESLVTDPEATLRRACGDLRLDYSPDMMTWPKEHAAIADPSHGSPTFRKLRRDGFGDSVDASLIELRTDAIPAEDLHWLETTFAQFNRAMEYPCNAAPGTTRPAGRAAATFEQTRRAHKQSGLFSRRRLSSNLQQFQRRTKRLLDDAARWVAPNSSE